MKKLVRAIMADVGNEVDAVGHSFTNQAPMSFMFLEPLVIIDDQWLRKDEAHWRFIGEAVPYGIGFISNIGHVAFY